MKEEPLTKKEVNTIGTSLVELVPTHNRVLLKGETLHSTLNLDKKEIDANAIFKFTVAGFGKNVKNVILNDEVIVNKYALTKVNVASNELSYDILSAQIRKKTKQEVEKLDKAVQLIEYFLCDEYEILAINNPKDVTRNLNNINTTE